ncbi:MAG TPA: GDSL-type esterase/lipase family protein [Puia sp.]|nr:GDSL-type esterase/lipase family protein [Puia sp.]
MLTLGDSYTIGEGVLLVETYPYQTVQLLRQQGYPFTAPEIIARTGWTTDELHTAIRGRRLLATYDFVTLLIGVNNQYRGRSSEEYAVQFQVLLRQAIQFAAGRPDHVFVLSIPDWGVSPFAAGRDKADIARQIDQFNTTARSIAQAHEVGFIDITPHSRGNAQPFAADGLHPAAPQYSYWALQLADRIAQCLP